MDLCERCHQAEATVFVSQVVDGVMRSLQLCGPCGDDYLREAGLALEGTPEMEIAQRAASRDVKSQAGVWTPFPGVIKERLFALPPSNLPAKVALPERLRANDLAELLGVHVNTVSNAMLRLELMVEEEAWLDFDKAQAVCELLGVEAEREKK